MTTALYTRSHVCMLEGMGRRTEMDIYQELSDIVLWDYGKPKKTNQCDWALETPLGYDDYTSVRILLSNSYYVNV